MGKVSCSSLWSIVFRAIQSILETKFPCHAEFSSNEISLSCKVFLKRKSCHANYPSNEISMSCKLCCSMSCKEFLKRNFHAKQSFRNEISMSCKVFLILNSESKAPDSNVWQNLQKRRDTTHHKRFQFIPATSSPWLQFHNKCV